MSRTDPSRGPTPVQPQDRIAFVDVLRGFAVFGILVANMNSFAGTSTDLHTWSEPLDRAIIVLYRFFIEAKFYSLFSLLFGWGMAVQMSRAEARGTKFLPVYLRRLLVLLCIGIIHGIVIWVGDILTIYALYGFLLLLFRNRSERTILIATGLFLALSIVMVVPGEAMDAFRAGYARLTAPLRLGVIQDSLYASGSYWEITQLRAREFLAGRSWFLYTLGNVFGMFLLGLYIGKRRIFHQIDQHQKLIRTVLGVSLVIGILFNGLYTWTLIRPDWVPIAYIGLFTRGARTLGAPALMLSYVTSIVLLSQSERWRRHLAPLASVGRGALSNYLLQSVVCTLLFYSYGLGIYGQIDPVLGLLLTMAIYVVQIRLSEWWFDRFRFGPIERVWRVLSYGTTRLRASAASTDDQKSALWRTIRRAIDRVNTRSALITVWVLLLLWAVALGVWHGQVQSSAPQTPAGAEANPTQIPEASGSQAGVATLDANQGQPGIRATPVVQPVTPNPTTAVASGDPLALASAFDAGAALAQIEILTGPPYLGRYPSTPEGWQAADYIADQFAQFGLQPAGDAGTFFQPFPFEYIAPAGSPYLVVTGPDGTVYEYTLYRDYSAIVRWYGGAGIADSDVVWANTCADRDLRSAELLGRILLCQTPAIREAERLAVEYGAVGLMLLTDPAQRPPDFGNTYFEPLIPEPIPTFRIYPTVVDELLLGSGMNEGHLSLRLTPAYLATKARLQLETIGAEACPTQGCLARNVLGVIPGRDPAYSGRVIIIGAHYDHLGQGPGGTIWAGANDNASGVAVMLELARTWQEQGYVPRYTVLFAAWDAEEQGLLGSTHYVQNPIYPLENTAAMIQFDMVGAGGDTLWIDGGGELGGQLLAVAQALGVEVEATNQGRSDHVPFQTAGVPASLLIWRFDGGEEPGYHRPMDTPDKIELEKLTSVGQITSITLAGLMESEASISELLGERAIAVEQDNLEAFLSTSLPEREAGDRAWFHDALTMGVTRMTLEARDLKVLGRTAVATVQMTFQQAAGSAGGESQARTSSMDVRFEHDGLGWRWAGPDLVWATPETGMDAPHPYAIAYPGDRMPNPGQLGQLAASKQAAIAAELGLIPVSGASILVYPDADTMRLDTALSLPRGLTSWVGSDIIKLVHSPEISTSQILTETLVQLSLADAGVTEAAAPWLWSGLPQLLGSHGDEPAVQETHLPRLQNLLAQDSAPASDTTAWAAVEYLRQRIGMQGIGQFISTLGQACQDGQCDSLAGLDQALYQVIGLDAAGFDLAWQERWRDRLAEAQAAIDSVLAARTQAVLAGDEDAFLQTVDPSVPNLIAEEQHWFSSIARPLPEGWRLDGTPIAILQDGDLLVRINLDTGSRARPTTFRAQFTRQNGQVFWAGTPLETLDQGLVRVLFPAGWEQAAHAIAKEALTTYAAVSDALGLVWTEPVTLKLYDSPADMLASISPHLVLGASGSAWTGDGGAVKVSLDQDPSLDSLRPDLAGHLTRYALYRMGVDSEWLLSGTSAYLAGRFDGGFTEEVLASSLKDLQDASGEGRLFGLESLPAELSLDTAELALVRAQAWDTVRYLIYTHGWQGLVNLLHDQARSKDLSVAFESALGQTVDEFEAAWADSLSRAHALPAWIEAANAFDVEAALQHIELLASPQLAGRKAGSPSAEAAATYIAGRFAEYGLQPIGDDGTFFQSFPISYTLLVASPRLEVAMGETGGGAIPFVYHADFLTLLDSGGGAGSVSGELVWVQDARSGGAGYQGVELGGRIAVRELSRAADADVVGEEMAAAMEHGAGGLILLGASEVQRQLAAKDLPPAASTDAIRTIPVLELTRSGSDRLREVIRDSLASRPDSAAVQPLGIQAQMEIPLSEPEARQTANVLGLLPGADPVLGQEVIVLGAHYDHVGDDPGGPVCFDPASSCESLAGFRYPGANDNASGVAVLLEMARLWRESGYQPKRSVLFAAWGAQEPGEFGLSYYLTNPTLPLTRTAALLQLDAVGGGGGYYLEAQGGTDREQLLLFNLRIAADWVDGRFAVRALAGPSDPAAFRAMGIPSLLISWRDASEDNLPVELADQVEPYRLGVTGRIVTLAVMATAR